MSEKRVSVRLGAVGGNQVKAELRGIGDAGARGLGRLSRETDIANARLAAFTRRARLAATAAAAAVVAAGAIMIRSGLQTIDQTAKLAQSLDTTVESLQVLERAADLSGVSMGAVEQATMQLTRRLSQAAGGAGPAAQALDRLSLSASELQSLPLDQRIALIQERLAEFVPEAERAAVASQLFGDRASLIFTRIDTATLRQATADVHDFGVVVSEQDADQVERTNDAISRLGLIWRGVSNQLAVAAAPALESVAEALASMARVTGPLGSAIKGLFENLGRLGTTAGTFAAFIAGRFVAGIVAATFSIGGLVTGLVFLRAALIRTGIGALIVGAGELVYQFTRLVAGAGGFGNAMDLLKDVVSEVWNRFTLRSDAAFARLQGAWSEALVGIYNALQSASDSVVAWANSTGNTFEGTFLAVEAIWGALPDVFRRVGALAINGLITVMELGIAGITEAINTVLTLGGLRPEWAITAPDLSAWKSVVPEAVDIGGRAREAYDSAFSDSPFEAPDLFGGMASDASGRAAGYSEAARMLTEAASRPMTAWQALRAAVTGAGADGAAALESAANSTDRFNEALEETEEEAASAGGAARQAGADAAAGAEVAATGWRAVAKTLSDYADSAADLGKGIGEILTGSFQSAESAFKSFVTTGKFDFKSLISSMLADLATLAFKNAVLGPVARFLSTSLPGFFGSVLHDGGIVGAAGPSRMVPAMAFANAPRMHQGGWAGLKSDEVPAILQRGERVLSRAEVAGGMGGGAADSRSVGVSINIDARGAQVGVAEQIAAGIRRELPGIIDATRAGISGRQSRGYRV